MKGKTMIKRILVPTDGSDSAQKAAGYAIDLAKQLKCAIIILSVIDNPTIMDQPVSDAEHNLLEPVEDYLREAAEAYTEEIKKICDENAVPSKIVITPGYPAEEIIKEAESGGADLIVIGSHGRSALAAAFLGSVTYSTIQKETKIPVLIVRR